MGRSAVEGDNMDARYMGFEVKIHRISNGEAEVTIIARSDQAKFEYPDQVAVAGDVLGYNRSGGFYHTHVPDVRRKT